MREMTYTQKTKVTRKEELIRAKKIRILKKRILIFTVSLVAFVIALVGANAITSAKEAPEPETIWDRQMFYKTVESGDTIYGIAQEIVNSLNDEEKGWADNSVESTARRLVESNPELGNSFDYAAAHLYPGMTLHVLMHVVAGEE